MQVFSFVLVRACIRPWSTDHTLKDCEYDIL